MSALEVRVVLLCLLLQGEGERLDLLLCAGECPDDGLGSLSLLSPGWVCGGRYRPVLCSVSPPDYLSLLTSLHPLEDRETVEVWTFQYYQYFIFSFDHLWWLSI